MVEAIFVCRLFIWVRSVYLCMCECTYPHMWPKVFNIKETSWCKVILYFASFTNVLKRIKDIWACRWYMLRAETYLQTSYTNNKINSPKFHSFVNCEGRNKNSHVLRNLQWVASVFKSKMQISSKSFCLLIWKTREEPYAKMLVYGWFSSVLMPTCICSPVTIRYIPPTVNSTSPDLTFPLFLISILPLGQGTTNVIKELFVYRE